MLNCYLPEYWIFCSRGTCIWILKICTVKIWLNYLSYKLPTNIYITCKECWGRRDRDHMVVGFTTTCEISAYHHISCEFESRSWLGVLDIALCDKVCQWLATCQWCSPVSSTNKTDHHDINEILLKVSFNIINNQTNQNR